MKKLFLALAGTAVLFASCDSETAQDQNEEAAQDQNNQTEEKAQSADEPTNESADEQNAPNQNEKATQTKPFTSEQNQQFNVRETNLPTTFITDGSYDVFRSNSEKFDMIRYESDDLGGGNLFHIQKGHYRINFSVAVGKSMSDDSISLFLLGSQENGSISFASEVEDIEVFVDGEQIATSTEGKSKLPSKEEASFEREFQDIDEIPKTIKVSVGKIVEVKETEREQAGHELDIKKHQDRERHEYDVNQTATFHKM